MIGQTLLHYRITDRLGAGGMGEVYRATDTNLDRDVAIKVLPPEVAQDEERLGRFRREAKVLAALNHTNIASIHGLEEANGQPFLVLELVEGEDLKERLDKGPIPFDEALEIATQIAEALEEAHAHGIVHRDLKPANVKLTPDGKVKVLDFGLAKAWAGETGSGTSSLDLSASPTLARSGTMAGVILGTAAYMSPEQAAGKAVDKRADIWSFGVVLFEMLTGRPLFAGETASEILASAMKDEPDWDRLPEGCPAAARRLLRRCLRKKPRERLQDIGDARLELEETVTGPGDDLSGGGAASGDRSGEAHRAWRVAAVAGGTALVLAGAVLFLGWREIGRKAPAQTVVQLDLNVPAELKARAFTQLSPDGRRVAFSATEVSPYGGIWVRPLDAPEARLLPGTEGAFEAFWSPDGASLAFFVGEGSRIALRRMDLGTGTALTLGHIDCCTWGGTWSRESGILISAQIGERTGLYSVPAAGATPILLGVGHGKRLRGPQFLPDGRRFLYSVDSEAEGVGGLWLASGDAPHGERLILPGPVRSAFYSDSGHLVYRLNDALMAHAFDVERGALIGTPRAIASSVGWLSASRNGVLLYWSGDGALRDLTWFDRDGRRLGTVGEPGRYREVELSPDEDSALVETGNNRDSDLWTLETDRGVGTRVTHQPGVDHDAVWSPDGREIYFSSDRSGDGVARLYRKRVGESGSPELLLDPGADAWAGPVSPDGATLLYLTAPTNDLWMLPLGEGAEAAPLVEAKHTINAPAISPDGRWLAYDADETGDWEVYVMPFRREGERVRVSIDGGRHPRWRGDGGEIFFLSPDDELMVAELNEVEGSLEVARARALFEIELDFSFYNVYDVTGDGQRFLAIVPEQESGSTFKVVVNWPSLVEGPP